MDDNTNNREVHPLNRNENTLDYKTIGEKAKELVAQMTLEEKAGLCSGKDFWYLKAVNRLGLTSIMMTDGPHGVRKQVDGPKDNLGVGESVPAVCFPTASALACSFDKELAYETGRAIGEECLQEKVSVLLGPGVNQKRSPLCGRNFEYYSEDPVLSGEMAAAFIQGVQSNGIGTSLKHFAVNNQEKRRMTINAVVDERTLRETYLKAFEIAVKKGKPWTVMCSYNRLNGTYSSENEYLLTDVLRKEWGFDGSVISDWGAVNDRVLGLKAGLDIEMPTSNGMNDRKIIQAVNSGQLQEDILDTAACRITELILKSMEGIREKYKYDAKEHHKLAVKAAEECAVLLKNQGNILPGSTKQKAAVIGALAEKPRYQGAGSSKIHPICVDNAIEAFKKLGFDVEYKKGYSIMETMASDAEDRILAEEACEAAKDKDIVYIFAGLVEGYESEGFDRKDLVLPENQNKLIEKVTKINPNVVVILSGGSVMKLSWEEQVKGILLMYLAGEGSMAAAVSLLLGRAVPSGKLAESWPYRSEDTPAYHYFPGGRKNVEYRESVFTGYRYYEAAKRAVHYPFGYGLSYTDFQYSGLSVDKNVLDYGDKLTVSFYITNTGSVVAKETALVFISHKNDRVFLPVKELKAFEKVSIGPGEKKLVKISLNTEDFGYYNTEIHDWYAESGIYDIMVGASSSDCGLKVSIELNNEEKKQPDYRKSVPSYFDLPSGDFIIQDKEFEALYGRKLPDDNESNGPYNSCNTLMDVSHTWLGKLMIKQVEKVALKGTKNSPQEKKMMVSMLKEMPFHSMVYSSGGRFSEKMMNAMLSCFNGHYVKGIIRLIKK